MRIQVIGDHPSALALAGNLRHAGYVVTDDFPTYTVTIQPTSDPHLVVDVVDCLFGRLAVWRIAELDPSGGVFVQARGGNVNDRAATIGIPADDPAAAVAVERGMVRALDEVQQIRSAGAQRLPAAAALTAVDINTVVQTLTHALELATADMGGAIKAELGKALAGVELRLTRELAGIGEHVEQVADGHQEAMTHTVRTVVAAVTAAQETVLADLAVRLPARRWWQVWT